MRFYIELKSGYNKIKLLIELLYKDERVERFKITGKDRFIVVETNRVLFRSKGLKHRKPDWKVIEGKVNYPQSFDQVKEAILKVLDNPV
jgi:hypothetical protein